MGESSGRKRIQIDVISDTVCPWCFVGKKNLDKAMEQSKDRFDFEVPPLPPPPRLLSCDCDLILAVDLRLWEVRWHPFLLSPSAPKEGMKKSEFYQQKFGNQSESINSRMKQVSARSQPTSACFHLTFCGQRWNSIAVSCAGLPEPRLRV